MSSISSPRQQAGASRSGVFALLVLFLLVALAALGGLPDTDDVSPFVVGLVVMIVITLGFAGAAWHLLFRPLPAGVKASTEAFLTGIQRQVIAALLLLVVILLSVGGVWDEIWHAKYGIPFGEDFFWRPHLMMYVAFGVSILLGFYGWFRILRDGKGSLQQRFRADRMFGMIVLIGTFMIYALPADPIWHSIYGEDLTAYSIPHVMIVLVFILLMVGASAMQSTLIERDGWRPAWRLDAFDVVPLVAYALMQMMVAILLGAEWELATANGTIEDFGWSSLAARPDWLLPVFLAFTATFAGTLAITTLRIAGAATITGLLTIGIRLLLVNSLEHTVRSVSPWLTMLPILMALDAIYFWRLQRAGQAAVWWQGGLAAAAAGLIAGIPLVNQFYIHPQIELAEIPQVLLPIVVSVLIASWMAQVIGLGLAQSDKYPVADAAGFQRRTAPAIILGVVAGAMVFLAGFILTATPPV